MANMGFLYSLGARAQEKRQQSIATLSATLKGGRPDVAAPTGSGEDHGL